MRGAIWGREEPFRSVRSNLGVRGAQAEVGLEADQSRGTGLDRVLLKADPSHGRSRVPALRAPKSPWRRDGTRSSARRHGGSHWLSRPLSGLSTSRTGRARSPPARSRRNQPRASPAAKRR